MGVSRLMITAGVSAALAWSHVSSVAIRCAKMCISRREALVARAYHSPEFQAVIRIPGLPRRTSKAHLILMWVGGAYLPETAGLAEGWVVERLHPAVGGSIVPAVRGALHVRILWTLTRHRVRGGRDNTGEAGEDAAGEDLGGEMHEERMESGRVSRAVQEGRRGVDTAEVGLWDRGKLRLVQEVEGVLDVHHIDVT